MKRKSFAGLPIPAYGRPSLATVGLLVTSVTSAGYFLTLRAGR